MSIVLSSSPFTVRQAIEFHYPEKNLIHVPPRLERRAFAIAKVIDIELTPIDERWLRRNRDVRRGRFLVRGFDLAKKEWRQFYVDSMWRPREFTEPLFRFAYLDPVYSKASPIYFGAPFTDTERRSPLFQEMLSRWNADLAISPDSRIIGVRPWN